MGLLSQKNKFNLLARVRGTLLFTPILQHTNLQSVDQPYSTRYSSQIMHFIFFCTSWIQNPLRVIRHKAVFYVLNQAWYHSWGYLLFNTFMKCFRYGVCSLIIILFTDSTNSLAKDARKAPKHLRLSLSPDITDPPLFTTFVLETVTGDKAKQVLQLPLLD